ncbi:MAG TPA: S8 family serine peptidase [Steroidobacteraceae bacterium]|nr:S8 family serine peptidase [Steroidobacteraceae bacterium]
MAAAALLATTHAAGQEFNPVAHEPRATGSANSLTVIVKLRAEPAAGSARKLASATDRGVALAKRTGLPMKLQREISERMLATRIELDGRDAGQALAALRADPQVEYVAEDHRRYAHATTPNDTLFDGQWFLQATEVSAVNAIGAWDRERGASGIVVAVLDTGVLYDHPDLKRAADGGKLLPGFDFIADPVHANDGNGRDADASDPGDWVDDDDRADSGFSNCTLADSSWHGTRVAGMIGALTDNGSGVAGLSWGSPILPVRVLGKCGGIDSDILAGMRWAAGLHVNGVADNPNPARILNMSLGSSGACEPSYQDVIAELTARKVLVVISAGNEGTVVSSPANCPGVAAVAAIRHAGSKVGFSSLGPEVTLAAPGGNCVNVNGGPCLFSLDTTSNSGTTTPAAFTFTNQFNNNLGTSFSAPIVSGIAALMLSRNTNLSTAQLLARLREGTRPFPTSVSDDATIQACHVPVNDTDFQLAQCLCTTSTCGAGMADAAGSVQAAERPIAAVSLPDSVSAGQTVAMDASGSAAACGRTIAGYSWMVLSPTVNPPAILGADTANASVIAPASTPVTLRLTVTDDQGQTDSVEIVIEPDRASSTAPASAGTTACPAGSSPPPPPPPGGGTTPPPSAPPSTPTLPKKSGGGGGGSLEVVSLILLGALGMGRRRPFPRTRFARCI